ncbi:MAG TPA: cation:proton antiporter [Candidatus Thermoplasmatota archaeon]|nr:cation:proton antiporter [Candidatus Thermoplasmatota archaeon]
MASSTATLLLDIAVVMAVAAVTTVLFHRLRLPTVLGYLAAGIIVGPYAFGVQLVQNTEATRVLAELGIVFLMFSVGLEFNVRKLLQVGPLVLVAAGLEILLMFYAGYTVGGWFGWAFVDRVFLGAVLSISSTTILTKVLIELKMLRSEHAPVVFALLVVEDVVAVLILTGLSTLALTGSIEPAAVARTLVSVVFFLVASIAIGVAVVPRVIDAVGRLENDEVLVVATLGLLFTVSLVAQLLGFSVALGAFLVGAVVAEAREARKLELRIVGLRDMFTAVFFVSVGMLVDPAVLVEHWGAVLVIAAAAVVGKILTVSTGAFVAGSPPSTALRAGISMAVVGEFSFIIADLGDRLGVTSDFFFPLVVGVSLATALASPILMRESDVLVRGLARVAPPPILTYVHFYHRWASRLGHAPTSGRMTGARRQFGRAVLHLGGMLGVLAATQWAARFLIANAVVPDDGLKFAIGVWISGGLLALPFAVGFARRANAFVRHLTDVIRPLGGADAPATRVVRNTVRFLATAALGALALVAASPFLPPGPVFVVVLVAVAASLWLLGESVLGLNRKIEDAIERAVHGEAPEERETLRRLIETDHPWAVESGRVTVPSGGVAEGRTLRDLQIRNRTGATIAVVHRGGEAVLNPLPDWRLHPGDRLTVIGEPAQVDAAVEMLRAQPSGTHAAAAIFREVELPDGSHFVGRTLAETRLRELTGATVAGITRAGVRLPHPPPDQRLEAGDVLLVLGSAGQVASAAVHLRAVGDGA